MPQFFDTITPPLAKWALQQPLFFISSAPLTGNHINNSPKGLTSSTFTIFSPTQCGYIDYTGSGAETISHLYENGRCTIMFCSFGPSPRIMRFFCKGEVVEWDTPEFEPLLAKMGKKRVDGARAIILLNAFKVQTSCGYGVPKLSPALLNSKDVDGNSEDAFVDRETLGHFAKVKVEKNEMREYQLGNNVWSLDGLPALRSARRDDGQWLETVDFRAKIRRNLKQKEALLLGVFLGVFISVAGALLQISLLGA